MRPSLLLVHGFVSTSQSYFLPSLRQRFENRCAVISPDFPQPQTPDIDAWTTAFLALPQQKFTTVVAHSLGGVFALSLLTRGLLSCDTLVTVGCSIGPKRNEHMQTFLRYPLNFDRVNERTKMLVIQSFDDPWTLPEYGIALLKNSTGQGMFYADKGHFECSELPLEILDAIARSLGQPREQDVPSAI